MGAGEACIDAFLQVEGRGGGPEAHTGNIFLVVLLEFLSPLGCRTYAHQQHPGCQRVQGAGVPHFQFLLSEVSDCGIFDFAYHIGGSPAVGLVDVEDYTFRIILDVVAEGLHPDSVNWYLLDPAQVASALKLLVQPDAGQSDGFPAADEAGR